MTRPAAGASWIIMPVIDCVDFTLQAVEDCLAQAGLPAPPRVLLIDNGSSREARAAYEALQFQHQNQVLCWFHNPPLGPPPQGTVNASWNAGLDFCWGLGAEHVLVVNNDVRLHPNTYACLLAVAVEHESLFVSAVGVREEDYIAAQHPDRGAGCYDPALLAEEKDLARGGPDFSCFLISKACHEAFPFDPGFTYFGDNDYHRQLRLAGEGARIYSINVPYLHYGSRTINRSDAARAASHAIFEAHKARYLEKWGGMPEQETFETPWGGASRA